MTSKTCKSCKQHKNLGDFSKATSNKDGYNNTCKPCVVVRNTEYWRTPKGRISQVFSVQKVSSRTRGHQAPAYTAAELLAWALQQGLLQMVEDWAAAGYDKQLTPSIDRLRVTEGYTLDNIRLVTWQENNDAQYEGRKSCAVITKQNRRVEQWSLSGELINTFDSIAAAARATGAVRTNINCMCTGSNPAIKSVAGFVWKYAIRQKEAA